MNNDTLNTGWFLVNTIQALLADRLVRVYPAMLVIETDKLRLTPCASVFELIFHLLLRKQRPAVTLILLRRIDIDYVTAFLLLV